MGTRLAETPVAVHVTQVCFNLADGVPEDLVHVSDPHSHGGHAHREREVVHLENDALARRVQRLTTEAGRTVSLRLPSGSAALRPGDVLAVTDTSFIVVETTTTSVVVVRPTGLRQMGEAAHALGNRHRQVQFFDESGAFGQVVFLTPNDHTVTDFLLATGVPFTVEDVTLEQPFRHAEHQH